MQVAIYSRVIDSERPLEVQELFTELIKHNIKPVLFKPFLNRSEIPFSCLPTFRFSMIPKTSMIQLIF